MSEITPLTKDQLFEKKIAENTGSDYNVGDISDVVPVTKDQSFLKEIALNSAGQSEDITELKEKATANAEAIEAMVNVNGAKNKLPCTATTATSGNVTFTVNLDGSVTVDTGGVAADANRYINVGIPSLKEGDKIILSGCPNDPDLWQGTQIDINGVTGTEQHGEELHLTVTADMVNQPVRVRIAAGQELSNYTFYPMIRDARIADSTYVPYAMTNRELTEKTDSLDNKIAVKEESDHTANPTAFDTNGTGMILDLYNKNGVCVGHLVIRPKDYQNNIALELYTADWSSRPWTICKDILT